MARPAGSRNKSSRALKIIFERLEREDLLQPRAWLLKLQRIALGEEKDAEISDQLVALDKLLRFRFGNPASALTLEHEIGPGAEEILRRIASSEAHRMTLEKLEARRLRSSAVTTEVLPAERPEEEPCPTVAE